MWFVKEEAPDIPEFIPVGPPAGGNPRTAPEEGTTDPGTVDGRPPISEGAGAGEKNESGSTVGGAPS